jgi:TldD protein
VTTRRTFLHTGAAIAALTVVPRPLLAHLGARPEPVPPIQDPRIKSLALRAIEAARSAGASYADVRLTHTRTRGFSRPNVDAILDTEQMVVGARALVNGYWGFASGPVWSPDEMARLGREAFHQAKTNSLGQSRAVELAPTAAINDQHWVMPVDIDAFSVSPFEIVDHLQSLFNFVSRFPNFSNNRNGCEFQVQEKAFASTEGSYCTQRLYLSQGTFSVQLEENRRVLFSRDLDRLTPAGVGWELYKGQPMRDYIERLVEAIKEDQKLPVKPVDVGRYDTVFDAWSATQLLDETLGRATELDRALGYEANASGTSYLNEPLTMLGAYQAGASSLNVAGNRSEHGGAATVQWDDEGVKPDTLSLVKNGVLTDFQTTRESCEWIKDYYVKQGAAPRSHGCANAPTALEAPLSRSPNLTLASGTEALDFDALVAKVGKGVAVQEMGVDTDFQNLNGLGLGRMYEVKGGKRIARIMGAGLIFRGPELWRGLLALGGSQSVRRFGWQASKGEPAQETSHSVSAPAAAFKQLTFIDSTRKA